MNSPQVAAPAQPLTIITPAPRTQLKLSKETINLIRKTVLQLIDDDVKYSVTFSPLVCPQGKNYLYDLHPYYWKVPDGHWERRDGLRNPYCDIPEGPRQVEALAKAIMFLGLSATFIPADAGAVRNKADQLLRVFFVDEETRIRPEILYSQCLPGERPLRGNSLFVISARFLLVVSQYLPLLKLENDTGQAVKEWVRQHVQWMKHSEQGKECLARDDNKVVWYHAILASHLALVDCAQSQALAVDFFERTMKIMPSATDFFSKIPQRARPRHYALFLLEPTFIIASLTNEGGTPKAEVLAYLSTLVDHAATIQPGEMETVVDNDERFFTKLSVFRRLLACYQGEDVSSWALEGSAWSQGWSDAGKVAWALIQ